MKFYFLIERYFFNPSSLSFLISFMLLPLSFITLVVAYLRYLLSKEVDYNIPIVSVGNLILGGSGKTPLTISLAKRYKKGAIILRGYKRSSKGLVVVSIFGDVKVDVNVSGDEAMVYARELKEHCVIVSENRVDGILKAKELGCEVLFLDDGYSKHNIKKLDIVIKTDEKNPFFIPSGPFKDLLWRGKNGVVVKEGIDFNREVKIENNTKNMVLVTSISKPYRLNQYINFDIKKIHFPDHHNFNYEELQGIKNRYNCESFLVTTKDSVKMENFGFKLSILRLDVVIKEYIIDIIDGYVKGYYEA